MTSQSFDSSPLSPDDKTPCTPLKHRPNFGSVCRYMEFAQNKPNAEIQLANSAISGVPIERLGDLSEILNDTRESADGSLKLRSRIAERYGVHVNQIVPAGGTTEANLFAIKALIKPGDQVLVEWPGYEPIVDAVEDRGGIVTRLSRDPDQAFKIDLAELRELINPQIKLVAITNLHNPSSALLSSEEISDIINIATKHGAYLLIDEVYLGAAKDEVSAIHSGSDRVVVTSSLAKFPNLSYLKSGWLLCPREIGPYVQSIRDLVQPTTAPPLERIQERAWSMVADFEKEAHPLMEANLAVWKAFTGSEEMQNQLFDYNFTAGTIAFPRLLKAFDRSVDQLNDFLLDQKPSVGIVPGYRFGAPTHFRICLGLPTEDLKRGLAVLEYALSNRELWERP